MAGKWQFALCYLTLVGNGASSKDSSIVAIYTIVVLCFRQLLKGDNATTMRALYYPPITGPVNPGHVRYNMENFI